MCKNVILGADMESVDVSAQEVVTERVVCGERWWGW